MTFLTTLALAAVLLVVAPYFAHRLRRRNAEEQPFPPARLVDPAPPRARRRSRLEDRALFTTRSVAVVLLAVLGATPLVRCSRLSLQRSSGASVAVAIVLDDSMSMRSSAPARADPGASRFERARRGARELLASSREGDAVAIVLAGAPPRVALAPTTDIGAVSSTLAALSPSDRGTDLEAAIGLARTLLLPLPQVDHRVVLLSDLADGQPDAELSTEGSAPLWVALPELRAQGDDCAVMRAEQSGARVRVEVACGPGASAQGRAVVAEDADGRSLGQAPVPPGAAVAFAVLLPSEGVRAERARLSGADAIAADDVAPVVAEFGPGAIAVVADAVVATGGAPLADQALAALRTDLDVRPMATVPDHASDLAGIRGLLLDDPPGFTPEQRHAIGGYLDGGGVLLLTLGPHAAAAPLGASLEPVLAHGVDWAETKALGADPASAVGEIAESAPSLVDLDASRRAQLAPDDVSAFESMAKWTDGAPLFARRSVGRGDAWIVTLPLSVEASDLALRPAFLALLDAWVREVHARAAPTRSEVGSTWIFAGARTVELRGPDGAVQPTRGDGDFRFVPARLGAYRIRVDGKEETRVAAPVARELDLRARPAGAAASVAGVGGRSAPVDISSPVAFALLGLMAIEMALRVGSARRAR